MSEDIFNVLFITFKDVDIRNISDVINIIPKVMELVEKLAKLPGTEKKKLVIKVVLSLIKSQEISSVAEHVLPIAIDVIIEVSKGFYALQEKVCSKKCKGFCGCFGGNKTSKKITPHP